ncbi:MAG: mechanosensitive ion channel [Piscirickettsiaceae bacterium]|jgi:small conductance mechanosensitive channel|nr:mechanosensitive ion channel [Piscirickettsiaceae bacterium]
MTWVLNVAVAIAIILVGRIAVRWAIKMLGKMMARSEVDQILINFVSSIAKAVLLLLLIIAALNQVGVDTTSLIALIGAAGLAVGLALQNSLQNFAAGVMMIVFRPFKLGDFIEAGGVVGVVEQISIFSTMLKTGDNREIIVPNGQIYADAITNYSARETRRIDMVFGIGYDDDLLEAKKLMESILSAHELVLSDPAPVVAISELADSSVNFNVRPWVKSGDYWGVRAELIEQIKLAFDENDISIPYPHLSIVREGSSD